MKGGRLRAAGTGFLLAGAVAVLWGLLETIASKTHTFPDLLALLYGANAHLLCALAITVGLRLVFWRAGAHVFPWIALGGLLAVELAGVSTFWLAAGSVLPSFATPQGRALTSVTALLGLICALVIPWGAYRLVGRWRRAALGRTPGGLLGILLAVLVILVNGALAWRGLSGRGLSAAAREAGRERSPVFVVLIDTLRRDHLSYFGYARETSTNLNRLLDESFVFTAAYTPGTWTIPSVASLFTGLYPTSHGIHGTRRSIPAGAPSLAGHFRSLGYNTAGFVDNPAINAMSGFAQGFATFFPSWPPWWGHCDRTVFERVAKRFARVRTRASWRRSFGDEINQVFFHWLDGRDDEPVFAYIHYMEPHAPYEPPAHARDAVAPGAPMGPDTAPSFLDYMPGDECRDWECLADPPALPADQLAGMIANYDGEIHAVDGLVGELLSGLAQRGMLGRSHLLLLSDHGEEFADHQGWDHTYSIYEEITSCVMAYRPPGGLPAPRIIARPVAMLDLPRTLFDILDVAPPPLHQGVSIPELLGAPAPQTDRAILSEQPPFLYSLRLRDWKLIRRGPLSSPDWRLYNLLSDPGEQHNLASAETDTLALLKGHLEGALSALAQTTLGLPAEEVVDPEVLRRLRALGYVQ
jgi:arylsulfatase A-like enzyme